MKPRKAVLAAALALAAAAAAAGVVASRSSSPERLAAAPLTGDLSRSCGPGVNFCWTCKGPVALGRVTVAVASQTEAVEPVKLAAGCTGTIDDLEVVTDSADGIKVAEGAHDLTIASGLVRCNGRWNQTVHQDGIQVMGGDSITFRSVAVFCPPTAPAPGDLEHSCFFVNQAGASTVPPHAILFEDGYCASSGATVDVATSDASGVRGSTICPSVAVPDAFFKPSTPSGGGPAGTNIVDEGNAYPPSC